MSSEDDLVGRVLDEKYRIEERLRRGGMGAVYRATHVGTSRPVAIKVIAPELMKDAAVIERFKREARAAGQILHPNVVNVTDFGFTVVDEELVAYLVMEHLSGLTLAELLEHQPRPPLARVVAILQQTCAAVEEAHRHGVVHRDLKPENIWLESRAHGDYQVKVLDFGVAKLREEHPVEIVATEADAGEPSIRIVDPQAPTLAGPSSDRDALGTTPPDRAGGRTVTPGSITEYGTLLGTPLYMPPEQWLHRAVDARSDVYSLGVIAYQMLAGEVPFNGRSSSISMQHCRAPPAPLSKVAPGVPPVVAEAVMAALAKSPADRPPSAQSFAAALGAGAEGTGVILRRALVLSVTHFPSLFPLNAKAFGPAFIACAVRLADRLAVDAGLVPAHVGVVVGALCYAVYLLNITLLHAVAAGLFAPRVLHLLLTPHESPRPGVTPAEFVRCLRGTIGATFVFFLSFFAIGIAGRQPFFYLAHRAGLFPDDMVDFSSRLELLVHALIELPGVILICLILGRYTVYPSVVTMERLSGLSALRRAAALTRPFRRTSSTLLGLHVAVRWVAMWMFWLVVAQLARVPLLSVIDIAKDTMGADVGLLITLPIHLMSWTFTFTATALVYLDGRQAEGVTLEAISEPGVGPPAAQGAESERGESPSRRRTG